ncbi:MAG: DUF1501 domain-containing protein [Verrucomicrobia bacterium]|nr:DUF1501 domain-containing protein [Verrucomicrobiota bacterium]
MKPRLSRRHFLSRVRGGAASLPVLNTIVNLRLAGSLAAAEPASGEYRALVCVFLPGGIDSFNLLVPRGGAEYTEYRTIRQDLALPQASLLPITPDVSPGLDLGLHPGMSGIQTLFGEGKAACVANVGTLIEPVTKQQVNDASRALPLGLFSHSDQIEQWQTSIPNARSARGWAGRAADLLRDLNGQQDVSMNISLSGTNLWQSGDSTVEYAIGPEGAEELQGYDPESTDPWSLTPKRTVAIGEQLGLTYDHLLQQAFQTKRVKAIGAYGLFNSATDVTLPGSVVWPAGDFSGKLQMIAKAIAGRGALGQKRQTFFVQYGGWDHHDEVLTNMAGQVAGLSAGLLAFQRCLEALGVGDQVTLFTASDFARTLTSNGAGSDHAWGGNAFVMGGAVRGNRIYGAFPPLYADNPYDVGRGRLIPTTSVDSYFAELALWLGVSRTNLPLVLPNVASFFDPASGGAPLGFLL